MVKYIAFVALTLAIIAPVQAEREREARPLAESLGWLIGNWEHAAVSGESKSATTHMSFRWAAGQEVVLWEGTFAAEEATWSFAAVFFFDPVKDRSRVFAFNSNGQRHLGILTGSEPGTLVWKMGGLLPDGRKESFVMEFSKGEKNALVFRLRDRKPNDGERQGVSSVTLRRVPHSRQDRPVVRRLVAETHTLTSLADLIEKADLTDALNAPGPITVFAPSDTAMGRLNAALFDDLVKPENRNNLRALLLGHVVDGRIPVQQAMETGSAKTRAGTYLYLHRDKDGKPMANDAHIANADIEASNGIVHILDDVLVPRPDLIASARKNEELSTFLKAVEAAGLTETLRTSGPLTILAPNNDAFQALGEKTLADLLKPANKGKLAAILKYHVVPGWKHTYDKQQMDSLPTLQGGRIPISSPSAAHWKIELGTARLQRVNVDASNGVLHVVERVLMPTP